MRFGRILRPLGGFSESQVRINAISEAIQGIIMRFRVFQEVPEGAWGLHRHSDELHRGFKGVQALKYRVHHFAYVRKCKSEPLSKLSQHHYLTKILWVLARCIATGELISWASV